MQNSRQNILNAIRKRQRPEGDLPDLDGPWITFDDPQQQFAEVLEAVGGRCVVVKESGEINHALDQLPAFAQAKKVCSTVAGVGTQHATASQVDLSTVDDPHDLEDVDFAILPGQLAVAECAAVWVTDEALPHRAIYFIAQHLALVLPADQLVHNMHEAYARLEPAGATFGCFISGPSKTADIEQALVIGAHGPRSLTVFLIDG